ncbi:glycosyltransferase [Rhodococcus opacus]|nr:glycosyltransferase [Rhodococcus opacus]
MKNVQILVQAFIQSKLWSDGMSLDIVGFGSLEGNIRKDVESSGIRDHINVHGRIDDVESLADLYSESLFSVSPGYVGLSLTQSLGFGVPMLYAKNEPHAPEIELVRFAGTRDFSPSTVDALSEAMVSFAEDLRRSPTNRDSLAQQIQQHYSAESMADGLLRALRGEPMDLGLDGWPSSRWSGK